jgi:hypothetical protein
MSRSDCRSRPSEPFNDRRDGGWRNAVIATKATGYVEWELVSFDAA